MPAGSRRRGLSTTRATSGARRGLAPGARSPIAAGLGEANLDHHAYSRLGHAPSLRGYLWQMAALAGWSSLPYLHRIRQPTLVLTGDDDPIIRVVNGRVLAGRIPGARLHIIQGGGHLFLIDQARDWRRGSGTSSTAPPTARVKSHPVTLAPLRDAVSQLPLDRLRGRMIMSPASRRAQCSGGAPLCRLTHLFQEPLPRASAMLIEPRMSV